MTPGSPRTFPALLREWIYFKRAVGAEIAALVGTSASYLSYLQDDRANPRLSTMEKIATKGFGMSLDEFMAGPPNVVTQSGTQRLHAETRDRRLLPPAPAVPVSDADGAHLSVSQRAAQGFEQDLVSIRDITAALQSVVRQLVTELEAGRQAPAARSRSPRRPRADRKHRG